MKKTTFILTLMAFSLTGLSQGQIKGYWATEDENTIIEINESATGKLNGKIVWLEKTTSSDEQPLTDRMNPDKMLRDRPILGLDMLQDLSYANGEWKGKLYTPKTGKTVDVQFSMINENKLKLAITYRGFQREQIWTRTELPI